MPSNVTIKDIAKKAQVSTATVSNVLTRKKYVSTERVQRVYQAIQELGYRPNVYARTLKTNRSYTIGVQVPDITNPFFGDIVKTIQTEALRSGYQIVLYNSDSVSETEEKNVNSMLNTQLDGIISVAPRMDLGRLLEMADVPMVIVDRPPVKTERNVAFVYSDNYLGAASVADYLVEKGYRRFFCLAGPVGVVSNARLRVQGFRDTLLKRGIDEACCEIRYGDFSFQSGYGLMSEILSTYQPDGNPAAAFVTSDIMAWGAMEALKERRMKLPRDMGVVGYDNVYFSSFLYPKMTTVENPSGEMAANALRVLLNALDGSEKMQDIAVPLKCSLIVRESC